MYNYNGKWIQSKKTSKKKFKRLSNYNCGKRGMNKKKTENSFNLLLENYSELPHTSKIYFNKNLLEKYKITWIKHILIAKRLSKTISKVLIGAAFATSSSLFGIDAFPSIFDQNYKDEFRRPRDRGKDRGSLRLNEIDQLYHYGKNNNQQPQTLVHTFGTHESCARICPRSCIAQELEDLAMMQRWICPAKVKLF